MFSTLRTHPVHACGIYLTSDFLLSLVPRLPFGFLPLPLLLSAVCRLPSTLCHSPSAMTTYRLISSCLTCFTCFNRTVHCLPHLTTYPFPPLSLSSHLALALASYSEPPTDPHSPSNLSCFHHSHLCSAQPSSSVSSHSLILSIADRPNQPSHRQTRAHRSPLTA